jgi:hypothetical protein
MKRSGLNLLQVNALRRSIDTGVTFFGRDSVDDIEYSPEAAKLVSFTMSELDSRRKLRQVEPFKLILSDEVEAFDAARWMGKTVVRDYGHDFTVVEANKASASPDAIELATRDLTSRRHSNFFGFVFFVEQEDLSRPHQRGINRLRHSIAKLAVPTMSLVPTSGVEIYPEADQVTAETDSIVTPHFTLDARLEYPLILRRTPEPSFESS